MERSGGTYGCRLLYSSTGSRSSIQRRLAAHPAGWVWLPVLRRSVSPCVGRAGGPLAGPLDPLNPRDVCARLGVGCFGGFRWPGLGELFVIRCYEEPGGGASPLPRACGRSPQSTRPTIRSKSAIHFERERPAASNAGSMARSLSSVGLLTACRMAAAWQRPGRTGGRRRAECSSGRDGSGSACGAPGPNVADSAEPAGPAGPVSETEAVT